MKIGVMECWIVGVMGSISISGTTFNETIVYSHNPYQVSSPSTGED